MTKKPKGRYKAPAHLAKHLERPSAIERRKEAKRLQALWDDTEHVYATKIPETVHRFYDELESFFEILAASYGLTVYRYDQPEGSNWWTFNLIGEVAGKWIVLQIFTLEDMAVWYEAHVSTYVYTGTDDNNGWELVHSYQAGGTETVDQILSRAVEEIELYVRAVYAPDGSAKRLN